MTGSSLAGDPAAEDESRSGGLGAVWRAARARRRLLRAEVRRFTADRRRRRAVWIGAVGAVLLVVVGSLAAAYTPLSAVDRITIVGASSLDVAAVERALSSQLGTPLASVDDSAVKAALVGFPLVESYRLEARPPHELIVRIVERTPVGAVQGAAGFSVVDAAGVVLSTSTSPPGALPLLSPLGGIDSEAFRAIGRVMQALPDSIRTRVAAVTATTPHDVTLTFIDGGPKVMWGSAEESAKKALVLADLIAASPPETVREYDVSSVKAVIVR